MTSVLPRTDVQLEIDGGSLTIEDVVAVARGGAYAGLAHEAIGRIEAARELKRELIEREVPIYGVTTGFGDSAHRQIAPSKTAALQQNLLRDLGCGTGQTASPEVTRATMLLRANCLAKGNSGVRAELVERLLALLNGDVLPLIPERGSCGASGDLVPLSYIGSAIVGEVDVLTRGEVRTAGGALADPGSEPLDPAAK